MKEKFNFEVALVSIATLFLLLSANASIAQDLDEGLHRTVYESEALHYSSPNFSKASNSRYYKGRYHGYKSKRKFYRGNRYYRGGKSYYRGHRFNRFNRGYYPRNRYYNNRYHNRFRYGY